MTETSSSRRDVLAGLAGLACVAPGAAARAQGSASIAGDAAPQPPSRPHHVGALAIHTVKKGELLHDIMRVYDVGFVELRAANPGVDAWEPAEGTMLLVPTVHLLPRDEGQRIIVNVADMRLYRLGEDPLDVRSWPVGVGRDAHRTPVGVQTIGEKRPHPTWRPTPEHRKEQPWLPAAVPPGPDNPLGDYAMRVGWSSYNIHGTHKPDGVGRRVSRGCIRLFPEDIEELFGLTNVGDSVRITSEPAKAAWIGGELYLEIHPTGNQIAEAQLGRPMTEAALPGLDDLVLKAAGDQAERIAWDRVRSLERERSGLPCQITKPVLS